MTFWSEGQKLKVKSPNCALASDLVLEPEAHSAFVVCFSLLSQSEHRQSKMLRPARMVPKAKPIQSVKMNQIEKK